jgi:hypothetical protein
VRPRNYELDACGAAIGVHDRIELAVAQQSFDVSAVSPGESLRQRILGVKLRVLGDAIFGAHAWLPQLSLGAQLKRNRDFDLIPAGAGARDDDGVDLYVAATKVWLFGIAGRTTLFNGVVRATRANQFGLLGFGGDRRERYSLVPESSVAVFVHDKLAIGGEYRAKPDNLGAFTEHDAWDAFVAMFPSKHYSLTAAYTDLGSIAGLRSQTGWYVSLQATF